MIVYNYDPDLEVSDTCVRSSLLSWVWPVTTTHRELIAWLGADVCEITEVRFSSVHRAVSSWLSSAHLFTACVQPPHVNTVFPHSSRRCPLARSLARLSFCSHHFECFPVYNYSRPAPACLPACNAQQVRVWRRFDVVSLFTDRPQPAVADI